MGALNDNILFNNFNGSYYPQDYFYRFNYNKIYSVSSFLGSHSNGNLGITQIAPKEEDDCQNNSLTPPINHAVQTITFAILLAIILNTFERLIYYAFIAAVQVLILPFQTFYNFRIYVKHIIDWRPFDFFDKLVIEPLQRFGTVRLGIAIYPECETCDNLDYSNDLPNTSTNPADLYNEIATGSAIPPPPPVSASYTTDSQTVTVLPTYTTPAGTQIRTVSSVISLHGISGTTLGGAGDFGGGGGGTGIGAG